MTARRGLAPLLSPLAQETDMADSYGNPNTIPHAAGNGQMQELTPAQLTTKYGSGNVKTPSKNFTLNYKGAHMAFFANVPVVVDTALAAALTAAGAPVA